MFTDYWKVLVLNFPEMGNTIFFELPPKNDRKMIFTNYWKVIVLNFSVIGNAVFFVLKSWCKDNTYWLLESSCSGPWKVLVFNFSELGKTVFFWAKEMMLKIYLVFLRYFLRYSRTWEIWFLCSVDHTVNVSLEEELFARIDAINYFSVRSNLWYKQNQTIQSWILAIIGYWKRKQ